MQLTPVGVVKVSQKTWRNNLKRPATVLTNACKDLLIQPGPPLLGPPLQETPLLHPCILRQWCSRI